MKTWHIHIEGQVQGVGFRPFVYLLAQEYGLCGWVNNGTDGVHIEINTDDQTAALFYRNILKKAPKHASITAHRLFQTQQKSFDAFQIVHSAALVPPNLLLTPDLALCPDCRAELFDNSGNNRRAAYPFITCTACGPRFSIQRRLPYDRANTSMDAFVQCAQCAAEYQDPSDRRYYAQTNSCPDCRIELALYDSNRNRVSTDPASIIDQTVAFWRAGKIVAIKGIGGYLLTCDAAQAPTLERLRALKHRPSKPLALMYPDIGAIQQDLACGADEKELLESPAAPIVLLHPSRNTPLLSPGIAPNLHQIGVMLPYTPLFELLLQKFSQPIVATSGNISNAPIVFQDEKALLDLPRIADYVLVNNREIVVPQDDSVVCLTPFKRQKIVLRRARGVAPTYIHPGLNWSNQSILATGAMLKSTFSLQHQGNTYLSQYLGDLEHFDTQENYRHCIQHFLQLLNCTPEIILCDKHPDYPSTQYAVQVAEASGLPLERIQHHTAHFGAVLGEHNLIHAETPVLGVIWDGTGLGDDGHIWGGEFFTYEPYAFRRCCSFDSFDFVLGDKMPREPRISALSACWGVPGAEAVLQEKFSPTEWQVYSNLLEKGSLLQTSSVGRIFDAVAALLGLLDKQTYEGEAAMRLEALADGYFRKNGLDFSASYFSEGAHDFRIPTKTLMTNLILDIQKGKPREYIAAKFHYSLTQLVKIVAGKLGIGTIAFSGGVFQNSVLVDLLIHHLQAGFKLCFHRQLSPNDECISFGQLVCHQIRQHQQAAVPQLAETER